MSIVELKQNLSSVLRSLEEKGMKTTNISKSMGYTTTSQLHSIVDGDSLVSTKAIISMIENLNVNPTYLFLGKGEMFLTDVDEVEELRKKIRELEHNHSEAVKTVFALNDMIQKLEKRNADLIDLTSAAIKYHKGQGEEEDIVDSILHQKDPVKRAVETIRRMTGDTPDKTSQKTSDSGEKGEK